MRAKRAAKARPKHLAGDTSVPMDTTPRASMTRGDHRAAKKRPPDDPAVPPWARWAGWHARGVSFTLEQATPPLWVRRAAAFLAGGSVVGLVGLFR